jgi:hypothetical protein
VSAQHEYVLGKRVTEESISAWKREEKRKASPGREAGNEG